MAWGTSRLVGSNTGAYGAADNGVRQLTGSLGAQPSVNVAGGLQYGAGGQPGAGAAGLVDALGRRSSAPSAASYPEVSRAGAVDPSYSRAASMPDSMAASMGGSMGRSAGPGLGLPNTAPTVLPPNAPAPIQGGWQSTNFSNPTESWQQNWNALDPSLRMAFAQAKLPGADGKGWQNNPGQQFIWQALQGAGMSPQAVEAARTEAVNAQKANQFAGQSYAIQNGQLMQYGPNGAPTVAAQLANAGGVMPQSVGASPYLAQLYAQRIAAEQAKVGAHPDGYDWRANPQGLYDPNAAGGGGQSY